MKLAFLFLFLMPLGLYAQGVTLDRISETALVADFFIGVDDYKSSYHVTDNILFKTTDTQRMQHSALRLGRLGSVDILNPLKLTLFYPDTNTAVILDNTLTEITRINFTDLEDFKNVSHARTATERHLWIFNVDAQQLEIFDYSINKTVTVFPPEKDLASAMASNFNFCWIQVTDTLKKYNLYGSLLEEWPLEGPVRLAQRNGDLFSFHFDRWSLSQAEGLSTAHLYRLRTARENDVNATKKSKLTVLKKNATEFQTVTLPEMEVKGFFPNNEMLYIYDGRNIHSFRLKPSKN